MGGECLILAFGISLGKNGNAFGLRGLRYLRLFVADSGGVWRLFLQASGFILPLSNAHHRFHRRGQ
jgi:hypothetical protein